MRQSEKIGGSGMNFLIGVQTVPEGLRRTGI
jgi:hypothetical protein